MSSCFLVNLTEAQRRHDELDMHLGKARADYQAALERIETAKRGDDGLPPETLPTHTATVLSECKQAAVALDAKYNQGREHIKVRHVACGR